MKRTSHAGSASQRAVQRSIYSGAISALALALLPCASAHALEFNSTDFAGSLDTTVSYGAVYRMQDQDGKLISRSNGGSGDNGPITFDDGNLNFRKGEQVSEVAKVVSDLQVTFRRNYGMFLRGRAFYDFVIEDERRRHREISDDGKDYAGSRAEILDAFVYGSHEFGNRMLSARLGKQVINWGESIFVQNGISATNPFDVSALRAPGSELREAYLPTLMASLSVQVTDTVTLEGYWQPASSWEKVRLDPCGTYFSTTDALGDDGCDYLPIASVQEAFSAQLGNRTAFDSPAAVTAYVNQLPAALQPIAQQLLGSTFVRRSNDVEPNSAQYGASLRWFVPELNQTEFGAYYIRYSTQTPVVSAIAGSLATTPIGVVPDPSSARYFSEYIGGLDLYGLSFNTTLNGGLLDGLALSGEISYRPDSIVSKYTPSNVIAPAVTGALPGGTYIQGFEQRDRAQLSLAAVYLLSSGVFSADSGSLILEASANRIYGSLAPAMFDDPDLPGGMTNSSWGTTLSGSLSYFDVMSIFTLSPGVSVYSAINGRNGANNEGERAYSLKMDAIYKEKIGMEVGYTTYHGGGRKNRDRDFLSFNVKYSF